VALRRRRAHQRRGHDGTVGAAHRAGGSCAELASRRPLDCGRCIRCSDDVVGPRRRSRSMARPAQPHPRGVQLDAGVPHGWWPRPESGVVAPQRACPRHENRGGCRPWVRLLAHRSGRSRFGSELPLRRSVAGVLGLVPARRGAQRRASGAR
jgi:hypothetical protein